MEKKILFMDETGDHDLANIDRSYPIFGLLGVIFDYDYYMSTVKQELDSLKMNFFSTTEVILHTLEITRDKGNFIFCKDPQKRIPFYKAIDDLLEKLDYTMLFMVIDKRNYIQQYLLSAQYDPYIITLEFIVERFYNYLKDLSYRGINAVGKVVAESRDPKLDQLIDNEWQRIFINGTDYVSSRKIRTKITDFVIRPKKNNIAGLQIADLIATQEGRNYLDLQRKWGFNLNKKFRKGSSDQVLGYGKKIFP